MERQTSGHRVLLSLGSGRRGAFRTDGRGCWIQRRFVFCCQVPLRKQEKEGSGFLVLVERTAGFLLLDFRASLKRCLTPKGSQVYEYLLWGICTSTLRKRDQLEGMRVLSRARLGSLPRPSTERSKPLWWALRKFKHCGASLDRYYNMDIVDHKILVDTVLFKKS